MTPAERHDSWNRRVRPDLQLRQIHQAFRFWNAFIDANVMHSDLMPECLWMLDKMACVGVSACYPQEY